MNVIEQWDGKFLHQMFTWTHWISVIEIFQLIRPLMGNDFHENNDNYHPTTFGLDIGQLVG